MAIIAQTVFPDPTSPTTILAMGETLPLSPITTFLYISFTVFFCESVSENGNKDKSGEISHGENLIPSPDFLCCAACEMPSPKYNISSKAIRSKAFFKVFASVGACMFFSAYEIVGKPFSRRILSGRGSLICDITASNANFVIFSTNLLPKPWVIEYTGTKSGSGTPHMTCSYFVLVSCKTFFDAESLPQNLNCIPV